jgi:hypothetical protein
MNCLYFFLWKSLVFNSIFALFINAPNRANCQDASRTLKLKGNRCGCQSTARGEVTPTSIIVEV